MNEKMKNSLSLSLFEERDSIVKSSDKLASSIMIDKANSTATASASTSMMPMMFMMPIQQQMQQQQQMPNATTADAAGFPAKPS
jgi:hypothetical protein